MLFFLILLLSMMRDAAIPTRLPRVFSVMLKPVGSQCNLRCSYCYYLDKTLLYPQEPGRPAHGVMSDRTLREFIEQYIKANEADVINFCWHGGEPLMAGIDFFKRALKYQKKYGQGRKIENSLQTNGLLMNPNWCRFFHENQFLIGLSLDGPEDIHDSHRKTTAGGPSFKRVMRAVDMMNQYKVDFNTLSVVNKNCEGRGAEVYQFFKGIGSQYMQFIPIVEMLSPEQVAQLGQRERVISPQEACANPQAHLAPWSVSPLGYGQYMCDIYDEWIKEDVGRYFVQLFDATLANEFGAPPLLCAMSEICGLAPILEQNGDMYACDHFVYPENLLGNVRSRSVAQMQGSSPLYKFGISKATTLPEPCLSCEHYRLCTGGCLKHRFVQVEGEQYPHNYLCEAYKLFFSHVKPSMQFMSAQLKQGRSPMDVMQKFAAR